MFSKTIINLRWCMYMVQIGVPLSVQVKVGREGKNAG